MTPAKTAPRRTASEKVLTADGWKLAHTSPLRQAFFFERFVGARRVASVILCAKTSAGAWRELRRLTKPQVQVDHPQAGFRRR